MHCIAWHKPQQCAGSPKGARPLLSLPREVGAGPAEALPVLAGLHAGAGHAHAQLAGLAGQAAAVGAQRQARAAQLRAAPPPAMEKGSVLNAKT